MKEKYKNFKLFDYLKYKLKQSFKKEKKIELTIDEAIKYKQLEKEDIYFSLGTMFFPLVVSFWIGIFVIVMETAFHMNFQNAAYIIVPYLFKIWIPMIAALLLFGLYYNFRIAQQNIELIKKIVKERKKRK